MKALVTILATIVVVCVACGGDSADFKPLQGSWRPVEGEMAGKPLPEEFLKAAKLTIEGDKYRVMVSGQIDEGVLKVDTSKKPFAMDITGTEGPNKGKTILAIYEVKGDSLKICYALEGKERPKVLKTLPKTMLFMMTYKRDK